MDEASEDELWSELDDAGDHRRGEILLELADRCYHRNDLVQFESLVEAAAQAAERAGDDRLCAYARFNQAQGLMELDRPAEAIAHFLAAAGAFGLIGEQGDIALSHQRAGDAAALSGDATVALSHWRTALAIYEAEADALSSGRVHMSVGGELMAGDDARSAVAEFRAARASFRSARSAHHVSWADDATAEALIHQGHADQAVPLLKSCLDIAAVGASELARGYAGLRLALALRLTGDHAEALGYLNAARDAYVARESVMGVARCDLEAAHALRALGEFDDSETLYQSARSVFDALGADDYVALADKARAILLSDTDRPAEAFGAAAAGVEAAGQAANPALVADLALQLAACQLRLNWHEQALATVGRYQLESPTPGEDRHARLRRLDLVARVQLANGGGAELRDLLDDLLAHSEHTDPAVRASLYESRWALRVQADDPDADRDLAHAIALFLAAGDAQRAGELSGHLLPPDVPQPPHHDDLLSLRGLMRPSVDDADVARGPDS